MSTNQIIIPFSTETATSNFRGMQNYENNYISVTNPQPNRKIKKIYLTNLVIPKTYINIIDANNVVDYDPITVQSTRYQPFITTGIYERRNLLSAFASLMSVSIDNNYDVFGSSLPIYSDTEWTYKMNPKINNEIFGASFNSVMQITTAVNGNYYLAFIAEPNILQSESLDENVILAGIKSSTYTEPSETQVVLIDSTNKDIAFSLNGTTYNIILTEGQYTESTFATELQIQMRTIDSNFNVSAITKYGATGKYLLCVNTVNYNWYFEFTAAQLSSSSSIFSIFGGNSNTNYKCFVSADTGGTVTIDISNDVLSFTYLGINYAHEFDWQSSSPGLQTLNDLVTNALNSNVEVLGWTYRSHGNRSIIYNTDTNDWQINSNDSFSDLMGYETTGGAGYLFEDPIFIRTINSNILAKKISLINDMKNNVVHVYYGGTTYYVQVPLGHYTNATFTSQLETEFKKINAGFSVSQSNGYLTITSPTTDWYLHNTQNIGTPNNGLTWSKSLSVYVSIDHDHILNKMGYSSIDNNAAQDSLTIVMSRPMNLELDHLEFYSSIPFTNSNNNHKILTVPINSSVSSNENIKIDSTYKVDMPNIQLTTIDFTIGSNSKRVDFNGGIVTGNIILEY